MPAVTQFQMAFCRCLAWIGVCVCLYMCVCVPLPLTVLVSRHSSQQKDHKQHILRLLFMASIISSALGPLEDKYKTKHWEWSATVSLKRVSNLDRNLARGRPVYILCEGCNQTQWTPLTGAWTFQVHFLGKCIFEIKSGISQDLKY